MLIVVIGASRSCLFFSKHRNRGFSCVLRENTTYCVIMLCKGCVIIISLVAQIVSSVANEKVLPLDVREFRPVQDLERKMMLKSIFVAPTFQACPDGYVLDSHGQCHRIVRVDERTHLNNLIARLNKSYPKVHKRSSILAPATLPQPLEYQVVNIEDHGVSLQMRRPESEPLQLQLPTSISRIQKSNV